MHVYHKSTKRFSLLLLEDEEDYVHDWVVTCHWPETVKGNWQKLATLPGRLRLCTKSVFFEPDDIRIPIVRLPFRSVHALEALDRTSCRMVTNLLVKMKQNMADAPYMFEKGQLSTWQFTLLYAPLESFLRAARPLLEAAKLAPMELRKVLEAGVTEREAAVAFDSSRLVDFCERVLYDGGALQLTPLVREPGRLVVTDQRIYFQPLYNVAGATPVRSHPLCAVAAVARRRSSLRPIGLELFFIQQEDLPDGDTATLGQTWNGPSAFFAFRSESEREQVAGVLLSQEVLGSFVPMLGACDVSARGALLEAHGRWVSKVLMAWQHGKISNFDYLMYLNLAAGRSFNDLAQWPVFPWVLSNYSSRTLDLEDPANFRDLSKPVGALNPERLEEFRQRYREMPAGDPAMGGIPPFLYGTHYSTPGYVMFWLVRAAPAHMLRLQSGRFDAPDRLFCSMAECWEGVLQSSSDVKELIPEFYLPDTNFLVNSAHLPLGVRQNGRAVGDVELPPWANSPASFLATMRAALESPVVSSQLHHWIDLIFGFKQTGAAAVGADNVFYYLTYEGAVDVDTVDNPVELKALETQINEFGQTPKQLFVQPHPARIVTPPAPDPDTVFGASADTRVLTPVGGSDSDVTTRSPIALTLIATIMASATEDPPPDFMIQSPPSKPLSIPAPVVCPLSPTQSVAPPKTTYVPLVPAGSLTLSSHEDQTPTSTPRSTVSESVITRALSFSSSTTGFTETALSFRTGGGMSGLMTRARNALGGQGDSSSDLGSLGGAGGVISVGSENGAPVSTLGSRLSQALQDRLQDFTRMGPSPANIMDSFKGRTALAGGSSTSGQTQSTSWGWNSRPSSGAPRNPSPALISPRLPASCPATPRSWCALFPSTLSPVTSKQLQRKAISAVTCSDGVVYCVGDSGMLRVLNFWDLAHIRAMNLSGNLMSLALLPQASESSGQTQTATGLTGGSQYPLMLTGSHNKMVYAYSVEAGKLVGSFCAHEDAVSGIKIVNGTGGPHSRLATASFDCTFKLWSLSEGRQPWTPGAAQYPELEINDLDSAIWAMDVNAKGSLLVTGTEVGVVTAWDLRSGREVWHSALSDNYVSSVNISPCGNHVLVGAGDSYLSLLEWRRAGTPFAAVQCEAPICCCSTDGDLAIAGTEQGGVEMWSLAHMLRKETSGLPTPGNDSRYPPLRPQSKAACNSVFAGLLCTQDGTGTGAFPYLVTAHADGVLCAFAG